HAAYEAHRDAQGSRLGHGPPERRPSRAQERKGRGRETRERRILAKRTQRRACVLGANNQPAAAERLPRSLIYRNLQGAAQLERVSGLFLFLSRPALLRRRFVHHGFELHAVGVGEIDRVVGAPVIFAGRIDHGHAVRFEEGAERVHVVAARGLEGGVVKADVALAVLALSPLRIGGGDPEQRLAVAPAGHVGILVLELEAEKAEQLAVELLRAREVADAEHQVIDADNAGHDAFPRLLSVARIILHSSLPGLTRQSIVFAKFFRKRWTRGSSPRVTLIAHRAAKI